MDEDIISTDYYLSYDIDNNSILHNKNINENISPASITKLMTALILYENSKLNDLVTINYPKDYIFEGKVEFDRTSHGMQEAPSVGNIVTLHFYTELKKQ